MKDIQKSPIISVNVYDVKTPKHNSVEVKGRPFCALTYRKQGTVKINIDGKTMVSHKNCITLTPKNKSYTTEVLEDTQMTAIHFNCLHNNAFQTPFVFENHNPLLAELFDIIYKKYSAEDSCNYECFSRLYELLEMVLKHLKSTEERKLNPKIISAKKEIDAHFTDNDFNINKLAESLSVNTSFLRREFKKAYAVSPIAYLKDARLQKALLLLLSDYYSVDEIAKECGYSSTSYFIQVFHKAKGISPQKYKEQYFNK